MTVKEIDLESADALPSPPTPATTPLEVIAPENLPEGYKFNVTISGSNNIVAVIVVSKKTYIYFNLNQYLY